MQNSQKTYELLQEKDSKIESLLAEITHLKFELDKLRKLFSGKKQERFVEEPKEQLRLDLFSEVIETETKEEKIPEYTRKKTKRTEKPVRMPLSAHLKRVTEVIVPKDLPEGSIKIGEEITEVLEIKPSEIFVRRIVREKYIIANPIKTEDFDSDKVIVTPDLPSDLPLFASNAGAGLLAHLIVSKFVDHLPFYRIIQMFKRSGVVIPSSTINNWFINMCKLFEPLFDAIQKEVLESPYIQVDESPIQVLTKDKPGSSHKGYMWVYHSPKSGDIFFDYCKGRGKIYPKETLDGYEGIVQTDGYASYNQFETNPSIRLVACGVHVRRKFFEAKKEHPKICNYVLSGFQKIFESEKKIRELKPPPDEILKIRNQESKPILEKLEKYLCEKKLQILPKSQTGKAIAYALNFWKRLLVFLDEPMVLFDNNLIENSIRPLALGRKNYLFAGSHGGAKRVAMMYSFMGSCKLNGINPFEWLKSTLEKINSQKACDLHKLLPGYKGE